VKQIGFGAVPNYLPLIYILRVRRAAIVPCALHAGPKNCRPSLQFRRAFRIIFTFARTLARKTNEIKADPLGRRCLSAKGNLWLRRPWG
jgi:hypothetical protein